MQRNFKTFIDMKKLMMAIVCLMTTVISVNAQNNWSLQAKQNAVRIIKCTLKSPSSFILTNSFGEKIPVSEVSATYMGKEIEYDSIIYGKPSLITDSIEYIYDDKTKELIDSLVYTSNKYLITDIDSIIYYKRVYSPCYKCSFYYEAQNSYGGMTQEFAVVYVRKDEFVSKCLDYNYNYRKFIDYKIGKKTNGIKSPTLPKVKIIKTYMTRNKKEKTQDIHKMMSKDFEYLEKIDKEWKKTDESRKNGKKLWKNYTECNHSYEYGHFHSTAPEYEMRNCVKCMEEKLNCGEKLYKKLLKTRYKNWKKSKEYESRCKQHKEFEKKCKETKKRREIEQENNFKKLLNAY